MSDCQLSIEVSDSQVSPRPPCHQTFWTSTELWVTYALIGVSFHFKLPLSLWMSSGVIRSAGGWRVRISWACSSGDHFLNSWELTVFISYGVCVEDVSKGSVMQWSQLFCKILLTLLYIEMHTYVNKKGENRNKTETFTQMGDLLMWKVFLFYYFQEKIRKTFARVGKTPEWFFRFAFDATE